MRTSVRRGYVAIMEREGAEEHDRDRAHPAGVGRGAHQEPQDGGEHERAAERRAEPVHHEARHEP